MHLLFGIVGTPGYGAIDTTCKPVKRLRSIGGEVKKKKYSEEIKAKALELLKTESAVKVCSDLKIKYATLLSWKKKAVKPKSKPKKHKVSEDANFEGIYRLQNQIEMQWLFIEYLKDRLAAHHDKA